jgi:GT2 family glycosyltransferase
VLAVVVTYGRKAHDSPAWDTLRAWLSKPTSSGLALRHVLVYDNSLQSMSPELSGTPHFTYQHDASNGGTRMAFIQAALLAHEHSCKWLLLLDQDTYLPHILLDAMTQALEQAPETAGAIVPRVLHGEHAVSPAVISNLGIVRPLPLAASPPPGRLLTAVASGCLLNVGAFKALGPIPTHLWLDGVDHWIFASLHAQQRAVHVADVMLQHELSVVDLAAMPVWRVLSVLASERALLGVLPWTARLTYPYRLLRHLERIRRFNPVAGRVAWQWALGRLDSTAARPPRRTLPLARCHEDGIATVALLLPIYNGERFLEAQLDSLLAQTYQDWICLVRDDGSNDSSMDIVRRYQMHHPDRFQIVEDNLGNLGTVGCLNVLAQRVDSPLFGFCDQDDVWLPQKLDASVRALQELQVSASMPALAYCDMTVTDAGLTPTALSFWDALDGRTYARNLAGLPVINVVAGCTMVGNRALLDAAFPVPACAPMHDYWIGIVAKYTGRFKAIEQPLILYRQHGHNQCGVVRRAPLLTRLSARLGALKRFREQAHNSRALRRAMLLALMSRQYPSLDVDNCVRAMHAEDGGSIRRLTYLIAQGIRPDHAFTYWLA